MIESKYTFEYIHPDDKTKQTATSHKYRYGFILGGVSLAALAYFLVTLPTKKTTYQPKVVMNQQSSTQKTEKIKTDNNAQNPAPTIKKETKEKQAPAISSIVSSTQKKLPANETTSNQASLSPKVKSFDRTQEDNQQEAKTNTIKAEVKDNLAALKAQLLDTQKRNKELATELDVQIMENMELSTLLEDSLYKINKEDKSYIKELKKLEKNTVVVTTGDKSNNKPLTNQTLPLLKPKNKEATAATVAKKVLTNTIRKKILEKQATDINRVDLSTSSQVNAIIANLNNSKNSSESSSPDKQKNQRATIETSKVKLQNDINSLINNKKESGADKFRKSLNDI